MRRSPTLFPALRLVLALAALAALTTSASRADLLMLRDGRRVVTRGTWTVQGERVVYSTPVGRSASFALAEVDLAASRAASPESAQASSTKPTTKSDAKLDAGPGEKIVLYSTSWCPWCRKARTLLRELDVPFDERDVEVDLSAAREKERLAPDSGVPVLVYGDRVLRGYSESAIRELAAAARRDSEAAKAAEETASGSPSASSKPRS